MKIKVLAGLLCVFGLGILPTMAVHLKPMPASKMGRGALPKVMDDAPCPPTPTPSPGG